MDNFGKTKVCSLLFALVTTANALGLFHLTPEHLQALQVLFGCGVAWGVRDAISKNGRDQ